jgi:uncharacterized membrane protein YbaN (DUF454 family)
MYGKKLDVVFRYTVCFFLLGIALSSVGFSTGIFEILYVGCTMAGLSTMVFIIVCILGSYKENRRYRQWLHQQRNNFDFEPVIIVVNPRVNHRLMRIHKKVFCFFWFFAGVYLPFFAFLRAARSLRAATSSARKRSSS